LSTVTVVLDDWRTRKLVSWAFVARTWHTEPASPGVRTDPAMVHVLPVDGTTAHVTAPVPEPPDMVNDRVSPYVTDVEVTVSAICAARAMVTVVPED
jgi:hypothetical protein